MRLDDHDAGDSIRDLGRGSGGGFGGLGGGGGGSGLGGLLFSILPMLLGRRMGCWTIALIAVAGFFLMNSGLFSAGSLTSAGGGEQASSSGNTACVRVSRTASTESCAESPSTRISSAPEPGPCSSQSASLARDCA